MSLSDEQWEFVKDLAKLTLYAEEHGFKLTGGELYRTKDQQALYVKSGLSKTMNSMHLVRCAQDYNIFKDIDGDGLKDFLSNGKQMKANAMELGDYWHSLNPAKNTSGFQWGWDYGHFQRTV